jgi:hypothetical protein
VAGRGAGLVRRRAPPRRTVCAVAQTLSCGTHAHPPSPGPSLALCAAPPCEKPSCQRAPARAQEERPCHHIRPPSPPTHSQQPAPRGPRPSAALPPRARAAIASPTPHPALRSSSQARTRLCAKSKGRERPAPMRAAQHWEFTQPVVSLGSQGPSHQLRHAAGRAARAPASLVSPHRGVPNCCRSAPHFALFLSISTPMLACTSVQPQKLPSRRGSQLVERMPYCGQRRGAGGRGS